MWMNIQETKDSVCVIFSPYLGPQSCWVYRHTPPGRVWGYPIMSHSLRTLVRSESWWQWTGSIEMNECRFDSGLTNIKHWLLLYVFHKDLSVTLSVRRSLVFFVCSIKTGILYFSDTCTLTKIERKRVCLSE